MQNKRSGNSLFASLPAIAACFVAVVCAASAMGQSHVRDAGRFFSPAAAQEAEASLAQLQKDKRRNVVIETFDAVPAPLRSALEGADKARAWSDFAVRQVKDQTADVYVFVSRTPAHLEIATEAGLTRSGFDAGARRSATDALVGSFRARNYDGGLREVVATLSRLPARSGTLAFEGPTAQTPPAATPSPRTADERGAAPSAPPAAAKKSGGFLGNLGCFGMLALGLVVLLVITIVRKIFGRRNPPGGYGQPGYGPQQPGQPGYGQQQPGQPGYGQGGGMMGQGGGGFGRGMAGGVLGGLLGGYLGNQAFGNSGNSGQSADPAAGTPPADPNTSGGDLGDQSSDFSSGGDFGGGDSGGDSSGGDF
jgi:hypothetical protein